MRENLKLDDTEELPKALEAELNKLTDIVKDMGATIWKYED